MKNAVDHIEKEIDKKYSIYRYLYLLFAICNYSLMSFFRNSISAITDVLQSQFNTTSSGVGLLSSFFYLSYLIFQLPSGMLLQKYSGKYLLLIVLIISLGILFSSLLFGLIITNSLIFVIIIRIICGIFGAPDWVMGATISAKYFGNNNVAMSMAAMSIIANSIVLGGVTFQAFIYQKYGLWRETYYIMALICFVVVICVIICMYCDKQTSSFYSVQNENKLLHKTPNDEIVEEIDNEIIEEIDNDKQSNSVYLVISNYLNWCLGIIGFCLFAIFSAYNGLWLMPYLMVKYNFSRSMSAFISSLGNVFAGIGSVLMGYFSKKYKKRKILIIFGTICQFITMIVIYIPVQYVSNNIFWIIIVILINFITGIGMSCNVLTFTLANEYNFSKKCSDTAQGFVNGVTVSSGFIIQFIIGYLLDYHWSHYGKQETNDDGTRKYDVNDYNFAFSFVVPTCCIVALLMASILKETNAKKI